MFQKNLLNIIAPLNLICLSWDKWTQSFTEESKQQLLLTASLLNSPRYFSEWFSVGMWRGHDDASMVMLAKITQKTIILLWLHCQLIIWHADKILIPQHPRLYFMHTEVWRLQENMNLLVMQSTTVTILERADFSICRIGIEQAVHLQTSCQCSLVLTSGGYFLKWEWISALSALFSFAETAVEVPVIF